MRAAEAQSTEDCPIKMKLVAPPLYVLTTSTLDKVKGVEVLSEACKACGDSIAANKGRFVIKEAARAVRVQPLAHMGLSGPVVGVLCLKACSRGIQGKHAVHGTIHVHGTIQAWNRSMLHAGPAGMHGLEGPEFDRVCKP